MPPAADRIPARSVLLAAVVLAFAAGSAPLGARAGAPAADSGAAASPPEELTGTYRAADGRLLIVWDLVDQMPGGRHQLAAFEPTSGWLRTLHRESGDRFGFGPGWFAPSPREGAIAFRPADGTLRREGPDGPLEAERAPIRRREVRFTSGEVELAGELVLPPEGTAEEPLPGLVMVPGFGRLTRRTPRIVADQFALAGLAVLIRDRRGTGASGGEYVPGAIFDYARDAEAALAYLRGRPEVDADRVGVMASSLGGLVAPLLHERDPDWAFFVCRVCPATPAWEQKVVSILHRGRSAGLDDADLLDALARKVLTARYALTREDYGALRTVEESTAGEAWRERVGDPEDWGPLAEPDARAWDVHRSVLEVDPGTMLGELDAPALLILGERDGRLPGDYHAMRARRIFERTGRPHQEARVLPGASHGLMEVRTDSAGRRLPFDRFVPGWHDRMVRWVAARVGADGSAPVVRTGSGALRGEELPSGVLAFRGVPYARPPVGERRWRPPEPPEPWAGIRDARAFAPACPQGDGTVAYYRRAARRLGRDTASVPERGPTSEDCLHLNVWTPDTSPEEALPVFVWVHGGAGTTGSGSDPLFRGERLARRGAVVVTVDYRLGPLGFLAHPALGAEDPDGVSGNYALRDLLRALRWIRENAAAFGGDPARVTVAGQSSGASLLETLLVVPAARGLFHRVVSHSATLVEPPPLRAPGEGPDAEAAGVRFLERLGLGPDARPAALRSLPVDSLLAAAAEAGPSAPSLPVVDGRLLPGDPAELWASGAYARVPILKGSTDDEFSLFVPPTPLPPAEYERWAEERYGALAPLVLEVRPPGPDAETARRRRVRVLSDQHFRVPELLAARWTEGRSPLHLYRFRWRPDDGAVGAFHSADLPFLFDTHEAAGWWPRDAAVTRLSAIVQEAWIRFAATGTPGAGGLPAWPAAGPERPRAMVLDGTPRMEPLEPLELLRRLADRLEGGSRAR